MAKLAKRTKSTVKAIFSRRKDASAIEVDDEDMPTVDIRLDGVFRWVQTISLRFKLNTSPGPDGGRAQVLAGRAAA